MTVPDGTGHGKFAFDAAVPFLNGGFNIAAVDFTGRGKIKGGFAHNGFYGHRRIMRAGNRHRDFLARHAAHHFLIACLLIRRQIPAIFHHVPHMFFNDSPGHAHLFFISSAGQSHCLSVIIHKASATGQVGMAVTADAVFLFQKILRRPGCGMRSVKCRDPHFPALKPTATAQNMFYFFI